MAGLYIHIPFCRHKCAYCDFYSTADISGMEAYVDALLIEWMLRKKEIAEDYETIYLGGGTPALLSDRLLAKLVEGLASGIDLSSLREFTIEANPEDITADRLRFFQSLGIGRISIGVQSFSNDELQRISRRHEAADSIEAMKVLSASGVNYSADLMYGLPGQDVSAWMCNVDMLLSFRPPHFSAYLLSYEQGTRMYVRLMKGLVREASEDEAVEMYDYLCGRAAASGYNHYEVSNFALPDCKAVHNSSYWNYTPYLGLGVSAHSFDGVLRRFNPSDLKRYVRFLAERKIVAVAEEESVLNRANDYIITSLRTDAGLSAEMFVRQFGQQLFDRFLHNARSLSADQLINTCDGFRIPEKQWLTSDTVMRELILD